MENLNRKKAIKIELANPDTIRSWSHGEVLKPETINYKTLKAEKDGLFDERIFGPTKNYECVCGRYKKANPMNKGKKCEKCGVELTESIVRRERMGHIELEEPVTHIWMLKVAPYRIAAILDLKAKELEEVVYFVSHIVLGQGNQKHFVEKEVLDLGSSRITKTREKLQLTILDVIDLINDPNHRDTKKANRLLEELKNTAVPFSIDEATSLISKYTGAKFGIGARAVEYLLEKVDLTKEIEAIKIQLENSKKTPNERTKLLKRLETFDSLKRSKQRPEWMVMRVIPVIPPDIRPIIQLDGGRFTTSEINDLYRRIIIRNERLKKVKEMGAPSIIVNNEKRMLQEAVDALFDNERKPKPVQGKNKRPLKSLTSVLKGKQGRFRQNLLGKRVDYSARSVIAIGPDLKMYQAGLPREMAITLFKPFVIQWLQDHEYAENVKIAEKMLLQNDPKVWEALEQVIKDRPVLLNRAPTLHRLGIQAFEPKLVKGKAIRLHPLVTTAFNADFDGDQMAVHVPITKEAVAESRALMLGSSAILGPKDGKAIVTPGQDIILGNYYLTTEEKNAKGQGMIFSSLDEAFMAYDSGQIHLNSLIGIALSALPEQKFSDKNQRLNSYLLTTVGKLYFNQIFDDNFPWINSNNIWNAKEAVKEFIYYFSQDINNVIENIQVQQPIKKKELSLIIERYFETHGARKTAEMLDKMKDLGFSFSTKSGTTISAGDVVAFTHKYDEFKEADQKVEQITDFYNMGMLTNSEKKRRIIEVWSDVKDKIQDELATVLRKDVKNPIFVMVDSGARGNISNFTQLVGMRGLMNDTKGDIKEIPIKSSFREGLTVSEYFVSTHGARKGMADIALKTADSGYLTRRLVDVSQEIVVVNEDCEPSKGFEVSAIIDTKHDNVIVPLKDRLVGRFTFEDIYDDDKNLVAFANTLIDKNIAEKIIMSGISSVVIRSVLTCDNKRGVCQKCYGLNLATASVVNIGEPVGVIAAQSIGEPGTQLTMRNFHTGGVAGNVDITQGLPRIKELLDVTTPKGAVAIISEVDGVVSEIEDYNGVFVINIVTENEEVKKYKTEFNSVLRVEQGSSVVAGQKLTEGAIDLHQLLEFGGIQDVQNYILKEVQKVYRLQGIEISDKYIEIIIKQMLNKVKITDGGDSDLLPGEVITIQNYKEVVQDCIVKSIRPPLSKAQIFGIKKAPLESSSWLSSASFQDTARVLTRAIIKGKEDKLEGLKENIMLGNLIPAGTGLTGTQEVEQLAEQYHNNEY
ncbi:DNA-directed RNA polymerase, beta' subunit [Mycoplasma mycoides subsp. mycoides]|uniref:DNA-directed RNA polymerase subunit beta' n=1 Tax=Mycoplasma mycoides TaxID=2102 RepID=UPI000767FEAB|nr:DNA-directed RNA polymerase subunit beta' [Mycoplasma mycoides]AME11189.1 DNA-directed RNA polymerase, beta' subunit [Mycoplasma mycoides subsp. mycoides]AME12202.1 DNA-directed RNA polymerase, beta' subunit [Mycoplasma mycoides subsp. mycoides]AME13252.1 DNA-directed RNA polymerase, beta' subunit [Mycoplasma mycoides subsp. mycoides]AME14235.1 DNA-directed RNA polymerase, beta' subunit [Mycoplasma mycoides subsp. mycoides]AME15215.1 DNA-directed RNA polymerase, beta' subunit [Mycoplasma my